MWSGPRTLSTATMRAWENRADTAVVDEPLYAYYLAATGIDHPGRDESSPARRPTGARSSTADRRTPPRRRDDRLPEAHDPPRAARGRPRRLRPLTHAFLIRDPRRLLASYAKVREPPTVDDLGLQQQVPCTGGSADRWSTPTTCSAIPRAPSRALRRPRRAVRPRDALVAGRAAGHGRRVGAVLVRERRGLDRLRTVARRRRPRPPRAPRPAGRASAAPLRRAGRSGHEELTCCRSSTSATATWSST